jgi:CysZ protein
MYQILLALKSYKDAISFSNKHNLWVYYIVPAIVSFFIFSGLAYLFYQFGNNLVAAVESFLPNQDSDKIWAKPLEIFIKILVYVFLFLFYLKTYRYIMLILLSPALSLLSEKVQEISQHTAPRPFDFSQLLADVIRGIKISFRNLFIEILLTVTLSILGLVIGFISPFTTILIILIESYFLGFSMIDYRNEFMRISAEESRQIIWKNKVFATGIGFFCTLMLFIPVLGVLIAPLLAVTAAGLGINELENDRFA